jgi:hypothetical protein
MVLGFNSTGLISDPIFTTWITPFVPWILRFYLTGTC